jgi:hypothetical protein
VTAAVTRKAWVRAPTVSGWTVPDRPATANGPFPSLVRTTTITPNVTSCAASVRRCCRVAPQTSKGSGRKASGSPLVEPNTHRATARSATHWNTSSRRRGADLRVDTATPSGAIVRTAPAWDAATVYAVGRKVPSRVNVTVSPAMTPNTEVLERREARPASPTRQHPPHHCGLGGVAHTEADGRERWSAAVQVGCAAEHDNADDHDRGPPRMWAGREEEGDREPRRRPPHGHGRPGWSEPDCRRPEHEDAQEHNGGGDRPPVQEVGRGGHRASLGSDAARWRHVICSWWRASGREGMTHSCAVDPWKWGTATTEGPAIVWTAEHPAAGPCLG